MKTNSFMTIFNRYLDVNTRLDKWQSHLVANVFWDANKSVSVSSGLEKNEKVSVYLPINTNDMSNYVDPISFKSNHVNKWTIQNGDIIVGHIVTDSIDKPSDLEKKYKDVYTVSSVTENFYGSQNMQHTQIGGV